MGRFAYQPIILEEKEYSKHGQTLVDIFTGHLYTNYNNLLKSATKRIEEKLDDIDQVYTDILEQTDVVLSLEDDYKFFINNTFKEAYDDLMDLYDYDKSVLQQYDILNKYSTFKNKILNYIKKYIANLKKANNFHDGLEQTYKVDIDSILLQSKDFSKYVQKQYSDVLVILNKLNQEIAKDNENENPYDYE